MDETAPVPDLYDPRLECGARTLMPRPANVPPHTHVCRNPVGHAAVIVATAPAGAAFAADLAAQLQRHRCGCGYRWE